MGSHFPVREFWKNTQKYCKSLGILSIQESGNHVKRHRNLRKCEIYSCENFKYSSKIFSVTQLQIASEMTDILQRRNR